VSCRWPPYQLNAQAAEDLSSPSDLRLNTATQSAPAIEVLISPVPSRRTGRRSASRSCITTHGVSPGAVREFTKNRFKELPSGPIIPDVGMRARRMATEDLGTVRHLQVPFLDRSIVARSAAFHGFAGQSSVLDCEPNGGEDPYCGSLAFGGDQEY
jgi:hypothetical protein